MERTGEALPSMVALLLHLRVRLPLATEREDTIVDGDLHLLLPHPGELCPDHEGVLPLVDVQKRDPCPPPPVRLPAPAAEEGVQHSVHLILNRHGVGERALPVDPRKYRIRCH